MIGTPVGNSSDTTYRKLFLGGLSYSTTEESLRSFFEKYGQVVEAAVITDRSTGKSKGFGFVTMATDEQAEAACRDKSPVIDGRKTNCNLAYIGKKNNTGFSAGMGQSVMYGQTPMQAYGQFMPQAAQMAQWAAYQQPGQAMAAPMMAQMAMGQAQPADPSAYMQNPQALAYYQGLQGMAAMQAYGQQPMGAQPMGQQPMGVQPMGAQPVGAQPAGQQGQYVQPNLGDGQYGQGSMPPTGGLF